MWFLTVPACYELSPAMTKTPTPCQPVTYNRDKLGINTNLNPICIRPDRPGPQGPLTEARPRRNLQEWSQETAALWTCEREAVN